MKRLFYLGIILAMAFEIAAIYFIMPFPGSQRVRNVELAYQLFTWRWPIRGMAVALILIGGWAAFRPRGWRKVLPATTLAMLVAVAYQTNLKMPADRIFLVPTALTMAPAAASEVALDRLVVGIEIAGDARAYPIQYIGYHHLATDTVAGRPIMVSYCTVCRTGRVFEPLVDGVHERWRLVGMDQFNAMLEDGTTKSWWRQANGEALVGPRRGRMLTEIPSRQVTLAQWLTLYPRSLIMQPDRGLQHRYLPGYGFEAGTSTSRLTGTDTASWGEKSWVVGVTLNGESRAYDWHQLRRDRIVNDRLGDAPIVVVLATDDASFFALRRPDDTPLVLVGDSLDGPAGRWSLAGRGGAFDLTTIQASQEFWHSWRTFQPATSRYGKDSVTHRAVPEGR